ncbi:MAG: PRC-barrel domain [Armatimonadetes bacterium]|jgi:sporulation protein YlmC with PRC-barrel domain|nr:PRC-barrel domain [Armatimonadota bacterium]
MGQMPENRLQAWMPMSDLEGKRDFNFTDIRGFKIMNTTGHKVGAVKEIYVDPNTLEPCFAFLSYEKFMNFNTKHYLVPWDELRIGEGYVQTRWTEEHLLPETIAEQEKNLPDGAPMPASMSSGRKTSGSPTGIDTSREMSPDKDMTPTPPGEYIDAEEEQTVASRS